MADIVVLIVLIILISLAAGYIIKEKKKGRGCIGCPNASKCGGSCHMQKE